MFSNLVKFILGVLLAIAVLLGSGLTVALYFINRNSAPPKPIFANDNPTVKPKNTKAVDIKITPSPSDPDIETTPSPEPTPTSTPSPKPTETPDKLPPGAYQGRVTWPSGLSLRSEPSSEAQRVGGVGVKQKIIVLEESDDKKWVKIRVDGTSEEGWVKVGNVERVDDTAQPDEDTANN
ncbi:MAG TPA: SH3 domain-containing protein [Nostocaceae cyanobacterium]|nr:SH3 domain-containing protein [Nostocaceae cyanobacterium]